MEVLGTVISETQNLWQALQSFELNEILSITGNKFEIYKFQSIVSIIRAVFQAAEGKQDLSKEEKKLLEELKDAVFQACIQVEEFSTLAENTLSEKQRSFFCLSENMQNSLHFGPLYKISKGVKKIRKKLDHMVDNKRYRFASDPGLVKNIEHEPMRKREIETRSYVDAESITGREQDLEKIVGMLLDPDIQQDVSFLSILGIAGMGKTTLAQLVFNDPRIKTAFPLRFWACVGDQDQIGVALREILASATRDNCYEDLTIDQVYSQLQQQLKGKRFLLVLDDVWTEDPVRWRHLEEHLVGSQMGSWIVVTTRSAQVARIIGGGACQIYSLQGLSHEASWRLFQMTAFGSEESNHLDEELVKLGREIVNRCAQLPLAITLIGSHLLGQDKSKWQSFVKKTGYENMNIHKILLLCYIQLESPLKSCISYCALFPKDFEMDKETLISLWMAQGYIVPLNDGQDMEDAGEEYFSILLKRCFFRGTKQNKLGEIMSCKMHDLIHDVALTVSNQEMCAISEFGAVLNHRVHHLSVVDEPWNDFGTLGYTNKILSLLHVGYNKLQGDNMSRLFLELIEKCKSLKALDLSGLFLKKLPNSIGRLLQLRYLNLSGNTKIEELPKTITNLLKLQTLNLQNCHKLKALPNDFCKLMKLRSLNIRSCSSLTFKPGDIGNLTSLHKLGDFILGDKERNSSWSELIDTLEDLKHLDNLRGSLNFVIWCPDAKSVAEKDTRKKELYPLRNKKHLWGIEFDFKNKELEEIKERLLDIEEVMELMKELQPSSRVKYIKVRRYNGVRLGWDNFPSSLVELVMQGCNELNFLPCLGDLPHLKVLHLLNLKKLMYIGEDSRLVNSSQPPTSQLGSEGLSSCYPSLVTLRLENLPMFEGWRSVAVDGHPHQVHIDDSSSSTDNEAQWQRLPCFARLNSLFVWNCQELSCIPYCPTVEDLRLINFNRRLCIMKSIARGENLVGVASSSNSCIGMARLTNVVISNIAWLNLLPKEAFYGLETLEIWNDKKVESLREAEEVFRSCSSILRVLIIHNCSNLRSVMSGGLKHLTALEKLELKNGESLKLSDEEEDGEEEDGVVEGEGSIGIEMVTWSSNLHSLHTLTLQGLPELVNLPNWMQFLPALKNLGISSCCGLKSLPDWMTKLTSLEQVSISSCSATLEKRCKNDPLGEDWPYIQHIPDSNIRFRNNVF